MLRPNADITLYHFANNKYTRINIKGVYWFALKQSNINKSGLTNADSISIHILADKVGNLQITTSRDLVVKGNIEFEFDNTSQATQSSSLTALKKDYEVFTVTAFDPKLYGSESMQHYELSCK